MPDCKCKFCDCDVEIWHGDICEACCWTKGIITLETAKDETDE